MTLKDLEESRRYPAHGVAVKIVVPQQAPCSSSPPDLGSLAEKAFISDVRHYPRQILQFGRSLMTRDPWAPMAGLGVRQRRELHDNIPRGVPGLWCGCRALVSPAAAAMIAWRRPGELQVGGPCWRLFSTPRLSGPSSPSFSFPSWHRRLSSIGYARPDHEPAPAPRR